MVDEVQDIKIGLEIHQRLATKKKLFCNCSSVGNEIKTREIRRKLHAVPSELGKVDAAALFESKKAPIHRYDFYKDTCCLVETDDEPPHEMNKEAVNLGLTICSMFNSEIIDEIHVMRKTVIDGSNTSGFQRTAIFGMNGNLKLDNGKNIGIQTIAIEEESCGIIGEQKGEIESFRLDRLGIPLVEIATAPDIKSGKEAKEVAERIGLMLRSTGKMMRGIGTIRQDINISIPGGARIEIKGVQELDLIETVIDNEVKRQKNLIRICEKIKEIRAKYPEIEKKIKQESESNENIIRKEIKDVTEIFRKTENKFIKRAIESGKNVLAMKFPGMKGMFGIELYPDYRYGSELSDYAKTQGLGGIIHSDEDINKYGFKNEIGELAAVLRLESDDGWIIVVGEKKQCENGLELVFRRAYETKVPEETRRADLEGKTHYMRPLPGSARMYPETDITPIRITEEMIAESMNFVSFKEIEERVRKMLNAEMAGKIIRSEKLNLFLELVEEGVNPTVAAVTCEDTLKSLKRDGHQISYLDEEDIKEVVILYRDGIITKAAIPEVLKELIKERIDREKNKQIFTWKTDLENILRQIVKEKKLARLKGEELKRIIEIEKIPNMQELMRKYRLNVEPADVGGIFR